jgi:hypothetical protein
MGACETARARGNGARGTRREQLTTTVVVKASNLRWPHRAAFGAAPWGHSGRRRGALGGTLTCWLRLSCAPMRASVRVIVLSGVLAALLGACGASAQLATQRRVIAYQDRLGAINRPFAHPPPNLAAGERMLVVALAAYRRLVPAPRLRAANAAVIAALKGELRALEQADRALADHDARALSAAESLDARARRRVARALAQIAAYASACRGDAARC